MARVVLLVRSGVGVGCYSGVAVMFIRLFLFLFLSFSSLSSFAVTYSQIAGKYCGVSRPDICAYYYPRNLGSTPAHWLKSTSVSGNRCYANFQRDDGTTYQTYVDMVNYPYCTGALSINCQCTQCVAPQVLNPSTGQCQLPCPVVPPAALPGVWISIGSGVDTCDSGCIHHWQIWHNIDSRGFSIQDRSHEQPGQFCSTGAASPPVALPPQCLSPSVVRSDGTCGPPDPVCKSWEMLQNHACVDKPCPTDKVLKCGTVNGVQECLCSRNYDCQPGTSLDAFGNCIPKSDCPAGQTKNPITLQCGAPPDPSCPNNTHREGLTCVADPSTPGQPDPPKKGPGTGDIDGDGQPNNGDDDSDGDGNKNGSDNDADNDGTPNAADKTPLGPGSESAKSLDGDFDGDGISNKLDLDRDGDGEPNSTDTTPDGPGSKPDTDPTGDNDGDGIPNSKDADADLDGDGVPNLIDTDRDGDGIPNGQDSSPDGPGSGTDPKKYDPSNDLDGDGIPNKNDNDRDGDGIPNASDPTPDGPGSAPTSETDLDGDGIPNGQDGDVDGDGIPNSEDKYPFDGGQGDGKKEDKKEGAGESTSLEGFDLYESREKTFTDVWSTFTTAIQAAPIALAGHDFFRISAVSGSCQTYTASVPFVDTSITIDAQCSAEVAEGLRIAGLIVLMIAAWVAFKIALL